MAHRAGSSNGNIGQLNASTKRKESPSDEDSIPKRQKSDSSGEDRSGRIGTVGVLSDDSSRNQKRQASAQDLEVYRSERPKRKDSPLGSRHGQQKRQKSVPQPSDSVLEERRVHGVGDKKKHKSKKHKHEHRDRKSSKSRSTSPYKARSLKSPMGPLSSGEQEAGEIDPGQLRPHERERHRSRPQSASFGQANGARGSPSSQSHHRRPTPGRDGSERGNRPVDKRSPVPSSFPQSSVLAHLRIDAIKLQKRLEEDAKQKAVDSQDQQLDASLGRARGKHTPIVWKDKNSSQKGDTGKSPNEKSAHIIMQSELEAFARDREDNDAPAAMKASPSGSDNEETLIPRESGSVSNGLQDPEVPVKSKWLMDDDDMQDAEEERADLRALNQHELKDVELDKKLQSDTEDSDGDNISTFQKTRPPVSMLNSSRSVDNYERIARISEGTYGIVHRQCMDPLCRDTTQGQGIGRVGPFVH